jgi:hypothetical protein
MKTHLLKIKTGADGYIHLDVPTDVIEYEVEVVVVISEVAEKKAPTKGFSDLVGKLKWQGDAVMEQRRLRDEW